MDYTKQLKSGRVLAKRGYVYYLYDSLALVTLDDQQVSLNIDRMNNGEMPYNRIYYGHYITMSRSYRQIMECENYLTGVTA